MLERLQTAKEHLFKYRPLIHELVIRDLKVIGDEIGQVDWGHATTGILSFGIFTVAFAKLGQYLNTLNLSLASFKGMAIAGGVSAFAAFVLSGDMQLLAWGAEGLAKMANNINKTIETFKGIKTINIKALNAKVTNVLDAVALIYSGLHGNTKTDRWGLGSVRPQDMKDLESVATSLGTTITTIGNISQQIIELSAKKMPTQEQMDAISSSLSTVIGGLSTMLDNLPPGMGSEGTAGNTASLSATMQSLKTAFASLIGEDGILAQIPQMLNRAQRLQRGGQIESLVPKMQALGQGLADIMRALALDEGAAATLSSDLSSIDLALDSLNSVIKKLKKIGKVEVDTSGTDNVKAYIQNLASAFDSSVVGDLTAQITTFVFAIKSALQVLRDMNEEIEVKVTVKLADGFKTSVDNVIERIKKAKDRIRKQKKGISITIPVSVNFSVSTNLGSALTKIKNGMSKLAEAGRGQHPITSHVGATGGQFSRNGVLYRSGGGSIFKPRGVDKIPAMLAEGEYVHKKQAVDFFGVDFMRKVNAMDVRGAMDALLTKAGTAVGVGRQSIINNTVNNNQRITQNINTNNPNFANARMGRFVGAL